MEESSRSIPSTDSSSNSTRFGRIPGTPKPPIDPPRRRSSLFFSKVLQHSCSPKTPDEATTERSESRSSDKHTCLSPSDRKEQSVSMSRSVAMPGHVAQMQKLFQTAKASFRLDVRFAASPVGSIDSRLPENGHSGNGDSSSSASPEDPTPPPSQTPSKDWRCSTAPRILAEFDMDVREPFPEGSPQLPDLVSIQVEQTNELVSEPLSSGFTSPVNAKTPCSEAGEHKSPPLDLSTGLSIRAGDESVNVALLDTKLVKEITTDDLQNSLSKLSVSHDRNMDVDRGDGSSISSYLGKQTGTGMRPTSELSGEASDIISLSGSAKAAATSAKMKRAMLADLFPKPPTHKSNSFSSPSPDHTSSHQHSAESRACPDPSLHQRGPAVLCPDPALHFRACLTRHYDGENSAAHAHIYPSTTREFPGHYNRATATGSPMPLLKTRPSTDSPRDMGRESHETMRASPHNRFHRLHQDVHHRPYPPATNEHFQPGWYYANEGLQPSARNGPALYSFSTAAAKVVGQDPAPDSRIRDSYRTDTLTPLAKPPSRYRKNGIIALANSRGIGQYYGGHGYNPRPQNRHSKPNNVQMPEGTRFRSSPPTLEVDATQVAPSRKRMREYTTPPIEILEDRAEPLEEIDPKLKLEEGEEIIEVDEETRAAVRMSLYGTPSAGSSMRELSPNVMTWRKGSIPSGSRKKRRPSYWDGDLKEIVRSPAARHIVSSPIKKDDIRSQQGEVEFENDRFNASKQENDDELDGISKIVERSTVLMEDIDMGG